MVNVQGNGHQVRGAVCLRLADAGDGRAAVHRLGRLLSGCRGVLRHIASAAQGDSDPGELFESAGQEPQYERDLGHRAAADQSELVGAPAGVRDSAGGSLGRLRVDLRRSVDPGSEHPPVRVQLEGGRHLQRRHQQGSEGRGATQ